MLKEIKEYLEYRKNKKIAKRAFAKTVATILPTIETFTTRGADIVQFVVNLIDEVQSKENTELIEITLDKISDVLKTEDNRLIEIFSYIANLQPDEIQKILSHAMVASNPEIKQTEK